jgi:hypothetical protein
MRRTALFLAAAAALLAPAAASAVPLDRTFTAPPSQQCDGDVCTSQGPLSQGVKVTVVVQGRGAVYIAGQKSNTVYRRTCRGTCWFIARPGSSVFVKAVEGRFAGFSGAYPSRARAYQFKARPTVSGNAPVIYARFLP